MNSSKAESSLSPMPEARPASAANKVGDGEVCLPMKSLPYAGAEAEADSISADSMELNDSFFTSVPTSHYSKTSQRKHRGRCRKLRQILSCHYLWQSSSLIAYAFRILFFFALIMIPGVVCHFCIPNVTYEGHEIVFWTFVASFVFLFYFAVHWLLRALTTLGRRWRPHSEWIFRIRHAKSYLALILHVVALAILWNTSKLKNAHFLLLHFKNVNRILFCLGAALVVFALKSALVSRILVRFSNRNYIDRLRDVLFVEKALNDLSRSRSIERTARMAALPQSPSPSPSQEPAAAAPLSQPSSQDDSDQLNLDSHVRQDIYSFHKLVERVECQYRLTTATDDESERVSMQHWISDQSKQMAKKLMKWLVHAPPHKDGPPAIHKKHLRSYIRPNASCDRLWRMMLGVSLSIVEDEGYTDTAKHTPFYMSHHIGGSEHAGLAATTTKSAEVPSKAAGINEKELAGFIARLYQEIQILDSSLASMASAVSKLNVLLSILIAVVLVVCFAFMFGQWTTVMTSLSGVLVSISFVFSATAKNLFECIIFLFVTHPFDVGDRIYMSLIPSAGPTGPVALPGGGVLVTNAPGSGTLDNLVVIEMNLLTTIFERWDGGRIIAPNYTLAIKPILNVRRSGALYESHRLQMDFTTPIAKIDQLKAMCEAFVRNEANDYMGNYLVITLDSFEDMNRMHITVNVKHRTNWQDFEGQIMRKSKFLMFLKDCLEKLEIRYTPPDQRIEILPSYDKVVQKLTA